MQPTIDAKDTIFIDETGCHPSMGPRQGWAPKGERPLGPEEAYSGGRRLSLIAAMDTRGPRRHAIIEGGVKRLDFLEVRRRRVVFVPPYGPSTNPIELAFSKIEPLVRKAAARSVSPLRHAFDRACSAITARDARNDIRHTGYW